MQIINNLGANAHFKQLRDQFESAGWAWEKPGDLATFREERPLLPQ